MRILTGHLQSAGSENPVAKQSKAGLQLSVPACMDSTQVFGKVTTRHKSAGSRKPFSAWMHTSWEQRFLHVMLHVCMQQPQLTPRRPVHLPCG